MICLARKPSEMMGGRGGGEEGMKKPGCSIALNKVVPFLTERQPEWFRTVEIWFEGAEQCFDCGIHSGRGSLHLLFGSSF